MVDDERRQALSLLANQAFGGPAPAEPEPADPELESSGAEPADPEPAGPEATAPETGEPEPPEPESGEPESSEPISSLPELIEANSWDPEWFNGLKVPIKVHGDSTEVSLADLVASHQMRSAAEKRLDEAKAKAAKVDEEIAERRAAAESQFALAAKLIEKVEKELDRDSAALEALRQDDPGEYAARKQDLEDRRRDLDRMRRDAAEEIDKAAEQARASTMEQQQTYLRAEQQALLDKLPAWKDETTAKTEKGELVEYLLGQGFTREDVLNAADHRLILVARKAMLYDKGQASAEAAKKKVVKVPKVLKPGTPKPQEQRDQEGIKKALADHRRIGTVDSALAAYRARKRAG